MRPMNAKPRFLATAIGSLPLTDPAKAVDLVLASIPDAPIWPQLPRLGLNEQMEIQYSEGMPNAVIDRDKGRLYFDTAKDYSEAFASFYETYMAGAEAKAGAGDFSAMAISPAFSKGIYALEARLKAEAKPRPFVKVQTTGPCSFALTLTDENKRAIYYNEEFRDVIIKALAMKCRWQIQKFKSFGREIICFIDEPILSAFGSSTYVSVKREDVVAHLKEVIDAVHAEGGLAGIHCCGNTEWSILTDAGVDILNFDAFGFGETIAMYPEAIKALLQRGGAIAWGVVPTSKAIREQTPEKLAEHLEKMMDHLAGKGIDKKLILDQAFVTPSCGTGSMEVADAVKVFETLHSVSKLLRAHHGF
jgi:methionine synthase II (cobalamin-independent)